MDDSSNFNPYEPPSAKDIPLREWAPIDYRNIMKRWRPLRLKYNFILLVVGLLTMISILPYFEGIFILGILFYGAFANLFFTLGVIPELFFAYTTQDSDLPTLRKFIFIAGLLFSIALTLFLGLEASYGLF